MSRKGNCWDNAPMESFWGKLKTEWLYGRRFRTREEAKRAVFEYIELFYNRKRSRSVNGYIPPLKMEAKSVNQESNGGVLNVHYS